MGDEHPLRERQCKQRGQELRREGPAPDPPAVLQRGKYRHPEGAEFYYDTYYTDDYDPPKDKERHEWQQDFEAAYYYLSRLSFPGMTVADWFVGGGTFPAAVKALGRRKFVGCDILQDCVDSTKKVLSDIQPGKGSDSRPNGVEPPGQTPG